MTERAVSEGPTDPAVSGGPTDPAVSGGPTDRAASEVLSFALVFSLVVASVAIISVSGVNSLQAARDAEQMNNAERAFDVLADNMADVYQRGAPSRATEINLVGAQLIADSNVTVNVTAVQFTTRDTVTKRLRPIIYEGNRERKLIYEAGAVFRTSPEGGLVVHEPPFMLNTNRGYLQIVAPQSDHVEGAGGSTVLLRATEKETNVSIAETAGGYTELYVNVTSPRADQWASYLEETPMTEYKRGTDASGDEFVTYEMDPAPTRVFVVSTEMDVTIDR